MPDDKSFFESPWVQLGAPLLASGLSVADRTRSGRISQAAGMGANAFTGYGDALRKQRLSQVEAEKEEAEKQTFQKTLDDYSKGSRPVQDDNSPEGGSVPEADMNAKAEGLEAVISGQPGASVPKPTFQLSSNQKQEIDLLNQTQGRKVAGARLAAFVGEHGKEQKAQPSHWGGPVQSGGQNVRYEYTSDGRQIAHDEGQIEPKTDTSQTPYEGFMSPDPAVRARTEAYQKSLHGPSAGAAANYSPFSDESGNYGYNNRTNTYEPSKGLNSQRMGEVVGPDFSDVESAGSSTAVSERGVVPPAQKPAPPVKEPLMKTGSRPSASGADIDGIAQGIDDGSIPPDMVKSMGRGDVARVAARVQKRGTNLTQRVLEYDAVKRHIQSQNGTVQLKLRQAVSNTSQENEVIGQLFEEWFQLAPASGFRVFNATTLAASKQVPGELGAKAATLEAQIGVFAGEYANVLMGGGVPTEHALNMAQVYVKSMNPAQARAAVKMVRQNIKMREHALASVGPSGVSQKTPYQIRNEDEATEGAHEAPQEGKTLSKSGRPIKQNAAGKWVYAD